MLHWTETNNGRHWFADSGYKAVIDGAEKDMIWNLDLAVDGEVWLATESSPELVADAIGMLPEFKTADEAKGYCQQQEDRLLGKGTV